MLARVFSFADVHDDMNLAEDFIKSVVTHVLSTNADDIAFFNERVDPEKVCVCACVLVHVLLMFLVQKLLQRLQNLVESPFERITYTQAIEILLQPENVCAGCYCCRL